MTLTEARRQWSKYDEQIRTNVRLVIAGTGMTRDIFSKCLGMSVQTLRSRINHPKNFTLAELRMVEYYADQYGILLKGIGNETDEYRMG